MKNIIRPLIPWQRRAISAGPSAEAVAARKTAKELSEKADVIYYERRHLLQRNHFAERIRLIYEGHGH